TYRRQRAVPRPYRHREIEGGDDADNTQRMPLLHHAMLWTFRSDGQTVKLTRKSNCKIADVDHFLHFTFTFRQNLPRLESYQPAQVMLGFAQCVAELANDIPSFRSRNLLPGLKSLLRANHG